MTERRRHGLLLGAAIAFLLAMGSLYWWATRPAPPIALRIPGPTTASPSASPPPAPKPTLSKGRDRAALKAAIEGQIEAIEPAAAEPTEAEDVLPAVELSVLVVDDTGEPLRHVPVVIRHSERRRPLRHYTDAYGRVTQRLDPGELFVSAERADGMLVTRSDTVEIDASEGGSWSAELVIASEPRAGLGVSIAPAADGVRIVAVHADTPAEAAGLQSGDVVTAVEGIPAAGMPLPDFVERMTGPEGSKVLFDVLRVDGSEERLQIERQFLESRRPGGP